MATILLLDDQKEILLLYSRILLKDGHNVFTANSVDEALKLAQSQPLDLIISDINMPGKSGLDFVAEIKSTYQNLMHIPLIFISGEQKPPAVLSGYADYLAKPVSIPSLRTSIAKVIAEAEKNNRVLEIHLGTLTAKSPIKVNFLTHSSLVVESLINFSANQIIEMDLPTLRRKGFLNTEFKVMSTASGPKDNYLITLAPIDILAYTEFFKNNFKKDTDQKSA